MRLAGTVQDASGLGVHDHVSWPFVDRDEFCRHAARFLADGLALGLRVMYSADGASDDLRADLAGLPGLEPALASGDLLLSPLAEVYPPGEVVEPDHILRLFAAATDEALALGYTGLRVVADATSLLGTPEQVEAFATWEHKADRYMTGHPFSAMCGFDRSRLPEHSVVSLACMHPATLEGATQFRLFAPDSGADLALAGEIDACTARDFTSSLARTGQWWGGELVVDAEGLEFVDHRGLISLRDFARNSGATAVLRTSNPVPQRVIGLLDLAGIRVEPPSPLEATP